MGVPAGTLPGMVRRPYAYAVAVALTSGLLAVAGALWLGLPLRDPDGVAGPSYIRLPGIVLLALAADIVPRAWYRTPRMVNFFTTARQIIRERWTWDRFRLVIIGLGCFYLSYVSYRNIKSFLPFFVTERYDDGLAELDRMLLFGHHPGIVMHELLGTGVSAHVLSWVYISYLFFVPISLAAALVWSTDIYKGFWYVTALCLNWLLGAISYYIVPSYGPAYPLSTQGDYNSLPETGVEALQSGLLWASVDVISDPTQTEALHGIAGFASLHVSVVFTAALVAHRLAMSRWIRWTLWAYNVLTVLATIYFGWHYLADDVGGALIGYLSVAVGAKATGYPPWSLRPFREETPVPPSDDEDDEPVPHSAVSGPAGGGEASGAGDEPSAGRSHGE